MSDRDIKLYVDGRETENQDVLDQLISSGLPLPADGNEYITLYQNLGSSPVRLPSNFSHLVVQKIIQLKVERARSGALSQSVLISFLSCLLGMGLLALHSFYTQLPIIGGLSMSPSFLLPLGGGLIMLMLIVLDGLLPSVSDRIRQ